MEYEVAMSVEFVGADQFHAVAADGDNVVVQFPHESVLRIVRLPAIDSNTYWSK